VTQVNLLPPEVRNRAKVRRLTTAAIGAVAAVLVLLMVVFVLQSSRLNRVDQQLAAQQTLNAGLRSKIAKLQTFEQLKQSVATKQAMVDALNTGQVLWSDVLEEISSSTPHGLWFTSVNGVLGQGATGSVVGNITFQGEGLDHLTVATWLDQLERIPGWANGWITQAAKGSSTTDTTGAPAPASASSNVTFSGSVDLTTGATSNGRVR
jgi:type IV pilus assembly protein PilN